MEKRNTMLLTVVAIATLLVAVIGATFAYFATTQDVLANIPIDVKTAAAAATFTAVADGEINITVDAYKMQQADAVNETRTDLTDNATLNVVLKAAAADKPSECRYNIIWSWTSPAYTLEGGTESKHYFPTADVPKEFTIQGTATNTNTTTGTNSPTLPETNFDQFPPEHKQIDISGSVGSGDTTNFKDVDYITLITNAKIVVTDPTNGGNVRWNFIVRFYNSTKDQSLLMGKSFAGTISIDPDSVAC